MLDDHLADSRMKWVLGIPQLQTCEDMGYGLMYEDEATVFNYFSPLFFSRLGQYQPFLQVLHNNKNSFTIFMVHGIALLLELLCYSEKCFNYVMSIPAPSIPNFI